uniref:2,3-bisphosphoglycerate-independent phosphoglycerate mutase n=1 Tax=Taenioma perpusillum TaxID=210852 RepID=A0A1Z1MRR9_9FLOR|nr:phosphoglycerate mutase [Taenioma perpusillum]ARW68451.1 phosphoglycerate mutase [Taenioma perpusillum]
MHNQSISPIILTILDGWGYSKTSKGNAIKLAKTPTIDRLLENNSYTLLSASGTDVGLPDNQMGNSEVGHTTIGAGRIINQDLVRIQKSIDSQEFFKNNTIHNICKNVEKRGSQLHLIGLCSNGGVHSHINHLKAIIKITKKYGIHVCLHLITDGRDTPAKVAVTFINQITDYIKNIKNTNICTISGRYYSMDRDCRWSRTEKAYKTLIEDQIINSAENCPDLIQKYYKKDISDEFIPPTRIRQGKISDNDGILFFNFRPDRIRQLLHSIIKENFKGFPVKKFKNLDVVTFTNYDSTLNLETVFPSQSQKNFLGQVLSDNGLKQLRLAETEKYAHVTYFFNGGVEEPFPGENRELIASPKVETYDMKPEMSAYQITSSLIKAINQNIYKIIIVNYANTDMVGHTGNLNATIEAVEVIDKCIKEIVHKTTEVNGTLIITADHGNADYMIDENNQPCKSHSTNSVPFILINGNISNYKLRNYGCLADIAPTILEILNIDIPKEMNGQSLLEQNIVSHA